MTQEPNSSISSLRCHGPQRLSGGEGGGPCSFNIVSGLWCTDSGHIFMDSVHYRWHNVSSLNCRYGRNGGGASLTIADMLALSVLTVDYTDIMLRARSRLHYPGRDIVNTKRKLAVYGPILKISIKATCFPAGWMRNVAEASLVWTSTSYT